MATFNLRTPNGYDGSRASKNRQGIVRLATDQEAALGIANNIAVTPVQVAVAGVNASFSSPPVLGFGSTIARPVASTTITSTGITNLASTSGVSLALGNTTGTLGFFGSAGATRATQAELTNNVTVGGVTGTIANYADMSVYANDSAAIRNNIYQLSLALRNIVTALRNYGLLI